MRNTKKTAVVGGTVVALMGAGIAFAAWTSTGTGTGTATATTDAGLTVTGGTAEGLFPTGSQTVTATVENNNPYKVALDSVVVTGIESNDANCNVESVTASSHTDLTTVLDATGGANDSATLDFQVSMSNDANNACQGDTFTIAFMASGQSTN